jgi:hypothetical protein
MFNKFYRVAGFAILAITVAFWGCAQKTPESIAELQAQLNEKETEIQQLHSSNTQKERQIDTFREQIAVYERTLASRGEEMPASMKTAGEAGTMELLPPEASAGECYARVFVPPDYRVVTEQVLKHEASERVEIIPAKYEWIEKKVLVREASERLEVVPAQYDWVEQKILVEAPSARMEEIPAKFEWVEEEILVEPAHTVWKKGTGLVEKVDNVTGEIMCLVEVPAKYKTIRTRVLREQAQTREVEIPASYRIVKKKVMVQGPTERKIEIPAEYTTVKVRQMAYPPHEKRIQIPAEYGTVTRRELVAEGKMDWQRVLCKTNVTPETISKIQTALTNDGYDTGPIDGIYGPWTRSALEEFQADYGLPTGGITYSTIEMLDIDL